MPLMFPAWVVVTGPTEEPVTLREAKLNCRVDPDATDEDGLIDGLIRAARQDAEAYLGKALPQQTLKAVFDDWAEVFWLPMAAPLQSVTTVKYYDAAGVQQTLASSAYLVDTTSEPGRVCRAPLQVWPALQADRANRIEITYVAGQATAAAIPENTKQGMQVLIVDRFDNRPGGTDAGWERAKSCWPDRVWLRPSCALR